MTSKPHSEYLWYLASPYSNFKDRVGGLDLAFELACEATGFLMKKGLQVYSPIAHSHSIAQFANIDPVDHEFWVRADTPFVNACDGLIVLTIEGWRTSKGVYHERTQFFLANKPIFYMGRGTCPSDLVAFIRG
jgi:Domain of unknown function (DUF1937)